MGAAAVSQTVPDPKVVTPDTLTASIEAVILSFESDGQTAAHDMDSIQREQSYHSRPSRECKMLDKCQVGE